MTRLPSRLLLLLLLVPLALHAASPLPRESLPTLELPAYATPPDSEIELPPLPPEWLGERPAGLHFTLRKIHFSGNRAINDEALHALLAPYHNQRVNIADLEEMRLALTRHYIAAGYINSGAILPDQPIRNGEVTFHLYEGRLDQVRIRGQGRLREAYLLQRLGSDQEILHIGRLQQRFQQLLSDPLIERLNGALHPGVQPGEAWLDLEVTRAKPYQLGVTLDNHRTPSVGEQSLRLDGELHNLSGWGDRLALEFSASEGVKEGNLRWRLPVGHRPATLSLGLEGSETSVVEGVLARAGVNIRSRFSALHLGYQWPLLQQLEQRLLLGVAFDLRTSNTRFFDGRGYPAAAGIEEDGAARTRVLRFSQEYSQRDSTNAMALRSTFNLGTPWFDATRHPSGPDGRYLSWIGQGRYAHRFSDHGQLLLTTSLQWSDRSLLPQERLAIGGAKSVRGYRENQQVRDQGGFLSVEYRRPLESGLGQQPGELHWALFADGGKGWNRGQFRDEKPLTSVGAGLLWQYQRLRAELYLAKALTAPPASDGYSLQDDGIHLRLRAEW